MAGISPGGRLTTKSLGDIYRVGDIYSAEDIYRLPSAPGEKEAEPAKSQEPPSDADPEPDPAIEREVFEDAVRGLPLENPSTEQSSSVVGHRPILWQMGMSVAEAGLICGPIAGGKTVAEVLKAWSPFQKKPKTD